MKLDAICDIESFVYEVTPSVYESFITQLEERAEGDKKTLRNFVAMHARKVNKAGPMADKKNDYKRKAKHSKKLDDKGE